MTRAPETLRPAAEPGLHRKLADVAGKYYVPKFGAFVIYTIMIIVLLLRPQGLFARASGK